MGFEVFREFGDLVAHNDARDRGLANRVMRRTELSIRYLFDYAQSQLRVDFSKPFPAYVVELLKLQIPTLNEERLRSLYNVTPRRLATRVDQIFKVDKKTKLAEMKVDRLSSETLGALWDVLGQVQRAPAFTQKTLLEEVVGVVGANRLAIDASAFKAVSERFVACALLLLHDTAFEIGPEASGRCQVMGSLDALMEQQQGLGNLDVVGIFTVAKPGGGPLNVMTWVMTTDLPASEWCSEEFLEWLRPGTHYPGRDMAVPPSLKMTADGRLGFL